MTPAVRELLQRDTFSPYQLAGSAAVYDISRLDSLIYDGSNRVQLVGDLSGNSAVNGLVSDGASGNGATLLSSAALNVGVNFCLLWEGSMVDWTPTAGSSLVGKYHSGDAKRQYVLNIETNGRPSVYVSADGGGTTTDLTASAGTGFTDGAVGAVRADWVGATASCTFYTASSLDGPWTQLGTVPTGTPRTPFSSDALVTVMGITALTVNRTAGKCNRTRIIDGTFAGGTVVLNLDFTTAAKLASSVVATTGQTATINTSGRFGARICGARDRVNMTQAEQPILTIAAGGNYLTYDGSNDCMASAPFPYAQPEMLYMVTSIITQGSNSVFFDGLSGAEVMECYSSVAGNLLSITANGGSAVATTALTTNVRSAIRVLFAGVTSSVGINLAAAPTGTVGATTSANGIIVGARSSIAAFGNITESELILRSAADSTPLQSRIARYFISKWRITP